MSRKGNCCENKRSAVSRAGRREGAARLNAVMQRFFLSRKTERDWQRDYANHTGAMSDSADYIVSFHNSVRPHSKLCNLPPNACEQQSAVAPSLGYGIT